MSKDDIKYYETLSKFGISYTEKSEEIIEAFKRLEDKDASPTSFEEYFKTISKSHNK